MGLGGTHGVEGYPSGLGIFLGEVGGWTPKNLCFSLKVHVFRTIIKNNIGKYLIDSIFN